MIRSLWISKTGLDAQQTQLDVISNNLANVSTNGFKRSRAVFEDLLYQTIRQPGAASSQQSNLPAGLQIGTGVRPVATARLFTGGFAMAKSGMQIAQVTGRHSLENNEGSLTFAPTPLIFVPRSFQPYDLSPLLRGPAGVTGRAG